MYCYFISESFLRYTVGDDFVDIITLACADSLGYIVSLIFYLRKGAQGKQLLVVSFVLTGALTALMLMIHGEPSTLSGGYFVAALIMMIRASLSMALNGLMLVTFTSFPIAYLATVYAIFEILGRFLGLAGTSLAVDADLLLNKLLVSFLSLGAASVVGILFNEGDQLILIPE